MCIVWLLKHSIYPLINTRRASVHSLTSLRIFSKRRRPLLLDFVSGGMIQQASMEVDNKPKAVASRGGLLPIQYVDHTAEAITILTSE